MRQDPDRLAIRMPFHRQHRSTIPSIFGISLADLRFTCIEPEPKTRHRCKNKINKTTTIPQAFDLWHEIARSTPLEDDIWYLLKELAERLHCFRHRKMDKFKSSLRLIVKFWHTELRVAYRADQQLDPDGEPAEALMHSETRMTYEESLLQKDFSSLATPNVGVARNDPVCVTIDSSSRMPLNRPSTPRRSHRAPPSRYTERFYPDRRGGISVPESTAHTQSAARTRDTEFIPYLSPSIYDHDTSSKPLSCPPHLKDILWKPLNADSPDSETGQLYIFSRSSDPNYVKIGFTKGPVLDRLKEWENGCNYKPKLRYQTGKLPWAGRLEKIVHGHLVWQRRKEAKCKSNPKCQREHNEWFEMSVTEAIGVVQRWESWALRYGPYELTNEGFRLTRKWLRRSIFSGHAFEDGSLDAKHIPWCHAVGFQRKQQGDLSSPSPSPQPRNIMLPYGRLNIVKIQARRSLSNSFGGPVAGTRSIKDYFTPSPSQSIRVITPTFTTQARVLQGAFSGNARTKLTLQRTLTLGSGASPDATFCRSSLHKSPPHIFPLYIFVLAVLVLYIRISLSMLEWCV